MPELTDAQKVLRNSTGIDMVAQLERIANGVSANINLGLTGAAVGDLVRVASVDANGKPTAWTHVPLCDITTNPNLLYNGYFIGGGSQQGGGQFPINQRGQTEYSTASKYCIDGWFLNGYPPTVNLLEDGLTIAKTSGNSPGFVSQNIDIPYEELAGRQVTMSVLYIYEDEIKLATGTGSFPTTKPADGGNVIDLSSQIPNGSSYSRLQIMSTGHVRASIGQTVGHSLKFLTIKVEPGDTQTLAHKEIVEGVEKWVPNELPDYGEELLKCQRYFQIFRTQALRPTYRQDYRPEMAVNPQSGGLPEEPTPGTITIDGTTYYTASAES